MINNLRALSISLVLLLASSGSSARTFLPSELEGSVPPYISAFVNRYLTEILTEHIPAGTAQSRMEFDDVKVSVPITVSSADSLSSANGLVLSLDRGTRYTLVWVRDSLEAGRMSFPASYNLILGTNMVESFNNLVDSLTKQSPHIASEEHRRVSTQPDSADVVRIDGNLFYLGHLSNHRWIDATNAHAVWSASFPAESICNLFCADNMPDTQVSLDMDSYNFVRYNITTSVHALRKIFKDKELCEVYAGVIDDSEDAAKITAVVVFHNPGLAYIHKLELTADVAALFGQTECNVPPISASLHPYIKLHNLTDLWGEKHNE